MRNKALLFVSILLLAFVAAPIFATGGTEVQEMSSDTQISAPGVYPIVDKTYNLDVLAVVDPAIPDLDTNYSVNWFEDKTNVHMNWTTISTAGDAAQKVNLVLSSGEKLPDVLINSDLTSPQQFLYGTQGILVPLNDLIDNYTVNISKVFADDPSVRQQLTMADGNIYSLSERPVAYHSTLSQKLWINQEWLTRLGLDIPKTTEEMLAVLRAFKDQDANGNGDPNDEIPYSGALGANRGAAGAFFMNAFIYDDGFGDAQNSNRLVLDRGKIFPAYTQPEWRDGLRYNHRLFTEGLFDAEAFVQDPGQLRALNQIAPTTARVGSFQMLHPGWAAPLSGELHKQYVVVPPLMGPQGVRTTALYPRNQRGSRFSLTADASDVSQIVAIRFADLAFELNKVGSGEPGLMMKEGEPGVDWRWAKPGEMSYTGDPAVWAILRSEGEMLADNKVLPHFMGGYWPGDLYDKSVWDGDPLYIEARLYLASLKYAPFAPKEDVPPFSYTTDEASEFGQLRSQINTYVTERFARFITGDLDIERDWDSYLSEFKALGLDRYIEIMQAAYDRQYEN
jgi:putative aldouronate transport system substrate-binding protein